VYDTVRVQDDARMAEPCMHQTTAHSRRARDVSSPTACKLQHTCLLTEIVATSLFLYWCFGSQTGQDRTRRVDVVSEKTTISIFVFVTDNDVECESGTN
jgi:hypothetical protein